MSGLFRSIVVSVLLNAAVICTARAQADPEVIGIRDRAGMYALGVMLDEGLGVEIDEQRAFAWYRRAAKLGHAESMNRLGILYLQGRGVPQNTLSAHSFPASLTPGIEGDGHVRWSAETTGTSFHRCGHRERRGLTSDAIVRVSTDSRCVDSGQ
jgi:hypothetical protein